LLAASIFRVAEEELYCHRVTTQLQLINIIIIIIYFAHRLGTSHLSDPNSNNSNQ